MTGTSSAGSSAGAASLGLGDLLGLLGQSNPLAQITRSFGQFQQGVDDFLVLVQQFGATMEQMNRVATRVNDLLDDVEPPIRALMPQVTRTLKAGDVIVDRLGSAVDLLADLGKALQPLAQLAESAGMLGLRPLGMLRDNATSGAADLVRRVTQFAAADTASTKHEPPAAPSADAPATKGASRARPRATAAPTKAAAAKKSSAKAATAKKTSTAKPSTSRR